METHKVLKYALAEQDYIFVFHFATHFYVMSTFTNYTQRINGTLQNM